MTFPIFFRISQIPGEVFSGKKEAVKYSKTVPVFHSYG